MEEINTKEFLSYLKRYIIGFILVITAAVSGVIIYDEIIKKPIYQASTTIVIAKTENANNAAATLNDVNTSQKLTTTYSEIAKSELVLNQVIKSLNLNTDVKELSSNVTVKPVEDTSILKVQVKDPDAAQSAAIANKIAEVFTDKITDIYKLDNVSQLSAAGVPESPANNTLVRDIIIATVVSVLGVAGFAFIRYYLDDTVKRSDDIEKEYGLPIAGQICRLDAKLKKSGVELIVEKHPKEIVSENIKSLRTNLQFTGIDDNVKTILVTSTNAGEGKSFVSANLAISFAQAGKRVLLVDCDLRKGRVHRLFGLLNQWGLSNLLADNLNNMYNYIQPTNTKNLSVLTCGTYPPNPSEILSSKKNKMLVEYLRTGYDIVIFDGAPVGGLADSVILSSFMDQTLIITRDAVTAKSDLRAAKDSLDKVGAKIAGLVFNFVNRKSSKYYNYYYGEQSKND